jgi:pimeloyl-ACP methyl ester carboxylesterase
VSFYHLHPDIGMNFQLNRVLTYGEQAGRFEDIRMIAARIRDFESWHSECFTLARKAEQEKRYLHAAYAYRLAEFYLTEDQPQKTKRYEDFIRCFYQAINPNEFERFTVPYEGSTMPVMRFKALDEKAVVVVHGGYDSFMEEFYPTVRQFPQQGYTILLFEGPGQGAALKCGLKFTHEWEKPVKAVLDYFSLSDVTLLGISWGGYLAMRAAAFESRITKSIAYDVCFDGLEVMTRPMPTPIRQFVRWLVRINARSLGNALIERMQKRSLLLDWVIAHGMYITGAQTPLDFYRLLSKHTMRGISRRITQDVLLLAGERDHYIPLDHLQRQRDALVNAHSVRSRLFLASEGGEQHCQVGNHQLAVEEIARWLDSFTRQVPSHEGFLDKEKEAR